MFLFILQVREGWEGSRSQPIQFILQEVYLLLLLLDDVEQLALVRNILRFLARIRIASIARVRLQTDDLHALLHLVLKFASHRLQLLVLRDFLLDFFFEFALHGLYCFYPLFCVDS